MGAIIAFTVGSSRAMNVTYAELRNGEYVVTRTKVNDFALIEFNIPAGTLREVVSAFEKKTGVTITATNVSIFDVPSPGVVGSYTVEQALREILKGTGVSYTFKGARVVDLNIQTESATVDILSSDAKIIDSPKYSGPLRDIPQTVSVISKEVIQQQGATTLRDVLNNVPGITLTAGEGGAPAGDNLTIRGFSARNDIYVDGVRDLGPQSRDPFNLEQVEVVKGPSSTFTGRGSTGGTINLVSKLPNLRRSVSGTLSAGTSSALRGTVDVNVPLSDSIALRVNAMGHNSDFPGREDVNYKRWGFAPSIQFGLGTPTRFSFSYFYLGQDNISDYGIPWVPANNNVLIDHRDRPAPVPRDTFYGFLERDHERLRSDLFTARLEHDFNDRVSLRHQFRYGYSRRDSIASPPRFASPNSTAINREMRSWMADDDIFDNQTDVTLRFRTGSIDHTAIVGASYSYEKNHRVLRTGPNSPTTLFDPNPRDTYTGVIEFNPLEPKVTANSLAGYVFDTVSFGKHWQLVGGLRWDRFDVEGRNVSGGAFVPIDRTDTIISGRAAVIFKPIDAGTIYASYGTSANPSLEGLLYQPADARTDPEKTRTYEAGTKWDLFAKRLLLSAAVFRVEKTDARTPSLVAGEPPTLEGDQRIQGVELSATGNFTKEWQVFAGYTLLDSEIVRSNNAAEVGNRTINTPDNSFTLWSTYRWDRLFFGGGPRYVGKRYSNAINTRVVEAYWVADAVVSLRLTKNMDVRMNVNNIGDKYYIDRIGGGHIVPGAGRSLIVSAGFNF